MLLHMMSTPRPRSDLFIARKWTFRGVSGDCISSTDLPISMYRELFLSVVHLYGKLDLVEQDP